MTNNCASGENFLKVEVGTRADKKQKETKEWAIVDFIGIYFNL